MKQGIIIFICLLTIYSCGTESPKEIPVVLSPIDGTWKLVSSTTIKKTDTTITDFTQGQEMIKVINNTHFAFLRHDTGQGKDTAIFSAGGGTYKLAGDKYTELLQYCNDRGWEGHEFSFTVSLKADTLLQTGVEKLEKENVDQFIIEKYVRVK
jgi:hypothetical protein